MNIFSCQRPTAAAWHANKTNSSHYWPLGGMFPGCTWLHSYVLIVWLCLVINKRKIQRFMRTLLLHLTCNSHCINLKGVFWSFKVWMLIISQALVRAGYRHDAEGLVWLPEAQIWRQVSLCHPLLHPDTPNNPLRRWWDSVNHVSRATEAVMLMAYFLTALAYRFITSPDRKQLRMQCDKTRLVP